MTLSEYLIEAVAKRTAGKYSIKYDDPTDWKVGDILSGQEGTFSYRPVWYKIISRTQKSIKCRRLAGRVTSGSKNMRWEEIPTGEFYDNLDYRVTITKQNKAMLRGTALYLWDGKPVLGTNA